MGKEFANFCGTCDEGEECNDGTCVISSGPSQSNGTCNNPLNLLESLTYGNDVFMAVDGSSVVPADGIIGYFTNEGAILEEAEV